MRFLANENLAAVVVRALRQAGFDTAWIREDAPGSTDDDVLARSVREGRVLLTFDLDFGELVMRRGARASCGVVLFRLVGSPLQVAKAVHNAIASRTDWAGKFSVVEQGRVRMRLLGGHTRMN